MMKNGAAYKLLYILIFFYFIVNCFKLALFNEIVYEILGYGIVIALFAVESKTDFYFKFTKEACLPNDENIQASYGVSTIAENPFPSHTLPQTGI